MCVCVCVCVYLKELKTLLNTLDFLFFQAPTVTHLCIY